MYSRALHYIIGPVLGCSYYCMLWKPLCLLVELSLNVVKDSLRRLKFQKERIAVHVDDTSATKSPQTIHRKMCDSIVHFVSITSTSNKPLGSLVSLLNALRSNKGRAQVIYLMCGLYCSIWLVLQYVTCIAA